MHSFSHICLYLFFRVRLLFAHTHLNPRPPQPGRTHSVVNPLPCTATQICFFHARNGECRALSASTCRFYHWSPRERHLFERTGVMPFYAGAGAAFGARPDSVAELFKGLPRTLRDRFEAVFRHESSSSSAASSTSCFTERDLADPAALHACAALSVSEAFDLCARLAAVRQRPAAAADGGGGARELLLTEIRAARLRLPVPGDGERLDKYGACGWCGCENAEYGCEWILIAC